MQPQQNASAVFHMVQISLQKKKKKKSIVTFHYDGVVLSLIPEQQGCLTVGEKRLESYMEELIVLWHPQNDIIAVWFHDNNNLQSSCINI